MRPLEPHLFLVRRGDRIRTCDRLVPNQERYRAALHPEGTINPNCGAKVLTFVQTTKLSRLFFLRRQKITCQRERMARGYRVTFFAY